MRSLGWSLIQSDRRVFFQDGGDLDPELDTQREPHVYAETSDASASPALQTLPAKPQELAVKLGQTHSQPAEGAHQPDLTRPSSRTARQEITAVYATCLQHIIMSTLEL